jgi:hypothetical protein
MSLPHHFNTSNNGFACDLNDSGQNDFLTFDNQANNNNGFSAIPLQDQLNNQYYGCVNLFRSNSNFIRELNAHVTNQAGNALVPNTNFGVAHFNPYSQQLSQSSIVPPNPSQMYSPVPDPLFPQCANEKCIIAVFCVVL